MAKENNNIKLLSISELLEKNLPPISWLIDELVPEEAITILSGMSGSFKTWLVMDMAISIATGREFLNIYNTKQTGVLIIDEESGERLYSERFKSLTDLNEMPIYLLSMSGFGVSGKSVKEIVEICKEKGIGLVIIDSMTRVNKGDENSSKDMALFFSKLRAFTKESISVLIIHHNRKPGQGGYDASSDMRCSSDIRAAVDIQLAVRRIGSSESIEVRQPKCRYNKEVTPFKLTFQKDKDSGKLGFKYDGTLVVKETKEELQEQAKLLRNTIIETVREFPGSNRRTITKAVSNLLGVSDYKVKTEILEMAKANILVTETGKYNTTLFTVSDEYSDSEEGVVSRE